MKHRAILAARRLCVALTLCAVFSTPAAAQQQHPESDDSLELPDVYIDPSTIKKAPSTLKGALADSMKLLFIEHSTRLLSEQTRHELRGPFVHDYLRSVKIPRQWDDGDSWMVNYIGHPVHGAAAGFIWLDHEDGAHDPNLGFSAEYWWSRSRAFAWATAYSLQFEFGPLSEASIGNVGMKPGTSGWVDHVVTPVGALGLIVAEDTLDRYWILRVESWTSNAFFRAAIRSVFNPSRSFSNIAQGRVPWYRVSRPLRY